ncbi:Type IV secretory pathway, VirD4 component, TraG/TraD family ATPase [Pseudonocardia ammonioxydans]|uniref:Type IV secretory pathway, VirD4 component, TraG/TraD family ATPase n=1 Tax=Pseudonocardia ammonioxydans TaxID=260086 RepID=A0A1I5GUX4_PSUAM|nr:TraM recognition domain-containing protein [Pseudonocardia ammonioxydans]SFO39818.1 Type IV secretory pathway, VirD4 component, TraG/TraD family ATPase [Pseudonocardia ammonioxydans]
MTGPELRSVALDECPDAAGVEYAPAPDAPAEVEPGGGRGSWPQIRATAARWAAASWWWGIAPVLRATVSSSSWSHLVERAAPVLCGGLVQLTGMVSLVLGTALLCWPSATSTGVGCVLLAVGVVLGLYRSWLGAGAGAALGVGLLFLPALAAAVAGGVLAVLGAVVLAAPLVRLAYPHSVRGRVRSGFGSTGWAGWWDRHRHLSAHAVRSAAVATRPSVAAEVTPAGVGARPAPGRVERLPVAQCGTWLGRSVVGPVLDSDCYAAHRDSIGQIAPPQTGKTALMGHHILDHCGPVLVTSTKVDLFEHCAGVRAQRGTVQLFNPEGLGDLGSSVWWSPIAGCAHPQTAAERAGLMVGATTSGEDDGDRWDDWSANVLTALLMAADIAGRDMHTVADWVFHPTSDARKGGAAEALAILHRAPTGQVPPGTVQSLRNVLSGEATKTRDSIFLTLSRAVQFMTDPQIAALATPTPGATEFDAGVFVTGCGAAFLVGSDRAHATVAPLLAALTGYVFETAKRVAATRPKGRLDPPLGMFLDEAALITPVPLDRWIADAGGRGIHIEWAVQSPSQLAQRWGARGADTIWNATNAKLVYGGLTLDEDLEKVSKLCGDRWEPAPTGDGTEKYTQVRVCPPDRVRRLPQWHALLIHRATPATVVRISPVWSRPDLLPPPAMPAPPAAVPAVEAPAPGQVAA